MPPAMRLAYLNFYEEAYLVTDLLVKEVPRSELLPAVVGAMTNDVQTLLERWALPGMIGDDGAGELANLVFRGTVPCADKLFTIHYNSNVVSTEVTIKVPRPAARSPSLAKPRPISWSISRSISPRARLDLTAISRPARAAHCPDRLSLRASPPSRPNRATPLSRPRPAGARVRQHGDAAARRA